MGKLEAAWPDLSVLFTDFPFVDFLLIYVTEKGSDLFSAGNKYVFKSHQNMCLKHQSTLTMTQARLVQHNSFPGVQKHGPDTAGSKITEALEAEESRWEEQAESQRVGKA